MENANDITVWIDEGLEGIRMESLAEALGINESGINYYFGGLDGFRTELLAMYEKRITLFLQHLGKIKTLDPEYLNGSSLSLRPRGS